MNFHLLAGRYVFDKHVKNKLLLELAFMSRYGVYGLEELDSFHRLIWVKGAVCHLDRISSVNFGCKARAELHRNKRNGAPRRQESIAIGCDDESSGCKRQGRDGAGRERSRQPPGSSTGRPSSPCPPLRRGCPVHVTCGLLHTLRCRPGKRLALIRGLPQ
jgi:hypothetical protein